MAEQTKREEPNLEQQAAIDCTDGPLLVIAGPGTGKTQLLSKRAANILATCDVGARNILCLTYTEAGAEAMKERLVRLVGREAYGIEVSTFHAFASSVKSRYPQYFTRNATAAAASELHAKEIIDAFLKGLPFGTPLSAPREGVANALGDVAAFISKMKSNGLSPDDARAIMRQNIAAADWLDAQEDLVALLNAEMPRKAAEKAEYVARFEELVHAAVACAPKTLTASTTSTPGICTPYLAWLDALVSRTPLMEGNKTEGFAAIRNAEFKKGADGIRRASVRSTSEKALVACDAYEHYQETLAREGLIDFDDMVMDCVTAVSENPALKYELQDRYRYIQVDEFQDTNGAQMRMVELLCEGLARPNIMAVGDDDQAIMRFQGASVAYIEQFRAKFAPRSIVLKTNYRSTPEIVNLGMEIAGQVEHRLVAGEDKQIRAHNPSGAQTAFAETVFATKELEYRALARDIRARIDAGFMEGRAHPEETIAVIGAKHKGLQALIPYLVAENVPFAYKVKSSIFEMESLQALLALLRYVAARAAGRDKLAESYLPQIVAAVELGGEHASSVRFALTARKDFHGSWTRALAASENPRLAELAQDLESWAAAAPSAPVRELVFRIAGRSLAFYRKQQGANPYAFAEFNAGIRKILAFTEAELGSAAKLGRTMKLPDVVERLDQAERFGIGIDAGIELDAPGAVRLTTAHSSKGLQYDLVYVLDADDATWHKSGASSGLYPGNLLINDAKDEDDDRRLLFVAVTRAQRYLEFYRAEGTMLREFRSDAEDAANAIGSAPAETDGPALGEAIMADWRQSYTFDTPELAVLLAEHLPPKSLSATALNDFVAYADGAPGCAEFPVKRVCDLPEAPSIALDFGNIVHGFLQQHVEQAVKAGNPNADGLADTYLRQVREMDFREEDVKQYIDRFRRVAGTFIPWAEERWAGRIVTEAALTAVVGDDVPLFGKCDLLLVDDEAETVRVIDYKTGKNYPGREPEPGYARQLRFYRLLVENSPEFSGYRVTSCENWYVEPETATGQIHDPVVTTVGDAEAEALTALIDAAWHRICAADFDTSAFEESELKAEALAAAKAQRAAKTATARILQTAYERWLVAVDTGEIEG